MFKKIMLGLCCIVAVFTLVGCNLEYDPGSEFKLNMVIVTIKAEYQQEFQEQEFTIENFDWENIEYINYYPFGYGDPNKTNGHIKIYLKEHGRAQVLDAIDHFKTLNFVYGASESLLFALDKFTLYVKETYHQKFIEQRFMIEDFKWQNVERITYSTWYNGLNEREITVYLNEHGREQVIDAIEHFRKLSFVKNAQVSYYLHID